MDELGDKIGCNLQIRFPPNAPTNDNPQAQILPSLSLNDFANFTRELAMARIADMLFQSNPLLTYLDGHEKREPPTCRERWIGRIRTYKNRMADAWLVLTGRRSIGDEW